MTSELAFGIDLGTTYSCAAVYLEGKVHIIENADGHRTTPSCIAFTDVERLYGDRARQQLPLNPANTVYDSKRMLGKTFDDQTVQADRNSWPFEIINHRGKIKIRVDCMGAKRSFFPEQISSMILSKLKESTETFLGHSISKAVITVPAYFNDAQRQATKDAGKIAGLNVLRIINEPTAAAIAFGFDERECSTKRKVLIFDLGGGTFDISVLAIEGGVFDVIAVTGDTHLGGQDFDNRMATYIADKFEHRFKQNVKDNKHCMNRLRVLCEQTKRALSSCTSAEFIIENVLDGIDFHDKITREEFEVCNNDLFEKMMKLTAEALKQAKMQKSDIEEVVLVGGSTRIPKIRVMLQDFFDGKVLNTKINADEAVAYGAAIQASIIANGNRGETEEIRLNDVTPFALGLETSGATMTVVIKQNAPIPTQASRTFSTTADNQSIARFVIYQGNRAMTRDNVRLGEFKIVGIPEAKAGQEVFDVTFAVDENGIVSVSAVNRSTGNRNEVHITKKNLHEDQMQALIDEAREFQIEDRDKLKSILARNNLESFCLRIKLLLTKPQLQKKMEKNDLNRIHSKCMEILQWLEETSTAAEDIFENKTKELEQLCYPLFQGTGKEAESLDNTVQAILVFGANEIPD